MPSSGACPEPKVMLTRRSAMRTQLVTIAVLSAVASTGALAGVLMAPNTATVAPVAPQVQTEPRGFDGSTQVADTSATPRVEVSATPVTTRTVVIVKRETVPVPTPKPSKGAKVTEPNEPQGPPVEPAVEVDPTPPAPTPEPTPVPNYDQPHGPWQTGGQPSSMNGQPDPKLDPVTPRDPSSTPPSP